MRSTGRLNRSFQSLVLQQVRNSQSSATLSCDTQQTPTQTTNTPSKLDIHSTTVFYLSSDPEHTQIFTHQRIAFHRTQQQPPSTYQRKNNNNHTSSTISLCSRKTPPNSCPPVAAALATESSSSSRAPNVASSVFFYFSVFLFRLFACTPQAISPYIHTTPGPNSNNNNTPSHHHPRLDPPPTPTHQRGRRGRRRALCDAKDARARVRPPYASACSVDARYDARRSSVPPPPPPMDIFQPRYERRQLIDDTEPLVATIESSHTVNGHTVRYLSPTPQPPSRPSGVHHHRAFSPSHPSRPHASSSC